ncbi:hypothetical protein [Trebonia sp.]|uniref:hypothetical protein n=1 Tax=Trebonia sp. TaxID=2767075 RepID=UPI002623C390|nr:hypothetical protein [Trebonia sp.]
MIRIRYKNLSPGLHGTAERCRRRTTVYLLPGLTGGQRRAALRRLRQQASRGYGPALPGLGLAFALAADRFRMGLRNAVAVVRLHPAGSLLPTVLAGVLMALFVLASMSARMAHMPQAAPGGGLAAAGSPIVVGSPVLASEAGSRDPGPAARGAAGGGGAGGGGSANAVGGPRKTLWSLTASSAPDPAGQGSRTPKPGRLTASQPARRPACQLTEYLRQSAPSPCRASPGSDGR